MYVRKLGNMTFFETGEYIKQLFRIKICKGGATVQAGIEFGIEAYPDDELELKLSRNVQSKKTPNLK